LQSYNGKKNSTDTATHRRAGNNGGPEADAPPPIRAGPSPSAVVLLRRHGTAYFPSLFRLRGRRRPGRAAPHVGAPELPVRCEAAVLGEGGAGARARPREMAARRAREHRLPQARRVPRLPLPRLRPHRPLFQGNSWRNSVTPGQYCGASLMSHYSLAPNI
jgi:hypothetical protein